MGGTVPVGILRFGDESKLFQAGRRDGGTVVEEDEFDVFAIASAAFDEGLRGEHSLGEEEELVFAVEDEKHIFLQERRSFGGLRRGQAG
jgi:hypothetical protein